MYEVKYHCEKCGESFIVRQGSRRRYCDACLTERVVAGCSKPEGVPRDLPLTK